MDKGAVGVDLGVKSLAVLSDGTEIVGPKPHKTTSKRLRRLSQLPNNWLFFPKPEQIA